jgi:hypothetical protein
MPLEVVKAGVRAVINGSGSYPWLNKWLERHYPKIYAWWSVQDHSKIGTSISKHFETKVMLHPDLIAYFKSHDIVGLNEYDGWSLDTKTDDPSIIGGVMNKIREISHNLFGVSVGIKEKTILNEMAEVRLEDLDKDLHHAEITIADLERKKDGWSPKQRGLYFYMKSKIKKLMPQIKSLLPLVPPSAPKIEIDPPTMTYTPPQPNRGEILLQSIINAPKPPLRPIVRPFQSYCLDRYSPICQT